MLVVTVFFFLNCRQGSLPLRRTKSKKKPWGPKRIHAPGLRSSFVAGGSDLVVVARTYRLT